MKFKLLLLPIFLIGLFFTNTYVKGQAPGDALDAFVKGENFRKQRQWKTALEQFDIAVQKDPSVYKYHYNKALCHLVLREADPAIASLEKTVSLKSDFVDAHERLARLYKITGKYDQSIAAYQNAFKYSTEPKSKTDYKLNIVLILDRTKRLEEAGAHVADLKKLAPDDLNVLYYEAKYSNAVGKYEQAKDAMLKATGMLATDNPKEIARYYFELGYAYHHLKMYEEKEKAFENAKFGPFMARITKLMPQYYHAIALSYFKVYNLDRSKELVEKALEMRKDFPQAHDLLVKIAASATDKSAVIEHQLSSIQTEPNAVKRSQKFADLAELQLESRKYEDAIKSADECLASQPKNYAVVFIKAISQHKMGATQDAIKTLEDLLQFPGIDAETKAQYNFALGMFYQGLEQSDQAAAAFTRAKYGSYKYAAYEELEKFKKNEEDLKDEKLEDMGEDEDGGE
ncbi:tetratricopeptide repeat protein [Bernardetia sp.]|uniref:tetratricopeptide repeat protein n=1 Tax=Bernardetia sp. TaxID=1937974 RepID=UPI0025B7ADA2|nr:tetratricopeptide repeat protein [Bernardetia sp.]